MFSQHSHLTRLFGLAAVVMSLSVGTATAAPTAGSTPQGLKADGLRLQAAARAYANRPAASYYTPEALKAQALRWQGIAATYKPAVATTAGSSFDWGDAGIGAGVGVAAFLSLLLLVVAGRRGRREKLAV
jgi:hypothetical protein